MTWSAKGSAFARGANRALRPLGWHLGRVEAPVDLRTRADDPIHGLYMAGGRPFLIEVPLKDIRGLINFAFPCAPGKGDPYIESVSAYLQGRCSSYEGSPIEAFYSAWKPENAAEAMGLPKDGASPALRRMLPHFIVLPWGNLTPEEEVRRSTDIARQENKRNGRPDLGVEHGTLNFGITPEKGRLEFERLRRIADSMMSRGFRRSDAPGGDIEGYLLIDGTSCVVSVRRGVHRIAVAAAMGIEHATIRIGSHNPAWSNAGVRYHEAECWPNVRSGLFTAPQARAVFRRMFEGRQPPGCPALAEVWQEPTLQKELG